MQIKCISEILTYIREKNLCSLKWWKAYQKAGYKGLVWKRVVYLLSIRNSSHVCHKYLSVKHTYIICPSYS